MRTLALFAAALFAATASHAAEPMAKAIGARSDCLDLIVAGKDKLIRLRLRVEIDGRSVVDIWDDTFARLFAYYDRDGNGVLDQKEAERLPSPFALRSALWGPMIPHSGGAPSWADLDQDGNGKVTLDELADYYRRAGLGGVLVGLGKPPATERLTDALLKCLDANNDSQVSEAEWKSAAETLRKLDRNDDELIVPSELVNKIAYPGANGASLLSAPAPTDKVVAEDGEPLLVILPIRETDLRWAAEIVRRRDRNGDGRLDLKESGLDKEMFTRLDLDRDGQLTAKELAGWRKIEPDICWRIRFTTKPDVPPILESIRNDKSEPLIDREGLTHQTVSLRMELRADDGKLPDAVAAARKRLTDRFEAADTTGEGFVDASKVAKRNLSELKQLIEIADRDGDGRLTKKELNEWMDLQEQIAKGHVLVTALDHGAGLFELLDADHDGSLSVLELRRAWQQINAAGCWQDGRFERERLPRQLMMTVSRGHPRSLPITARHVGPAWFRAMDRNGDGVVSKREFLGSAEEFKKLDADGDGLITLEEALAAEKKIKQ